MPKGKGKQTYTGGKFPVELDTGADQRQYQPGMPSSAGKQTYTPGHRLGNVDEQTGRPFNPKPVKGKGPQTHTPDRLGNVPVNDPSRPYKTE